MMGEYPDWYEGFKFDKPILAWVGSVNATLQVDGVQKILLGSDTNKNYGTGLIPRSKLVGKPKYRQSGIPDTVHQVSVKHSSGGHSVLVFKNYAQGWQAWQSAAPDLIAMDEQPNDYDSTEKPIFSECQTRLVRTSGMLLVGLTPLLGETDLTRHFMYPKADGIMRVTATWDDAPHLKEEDKERSRKTYPDHMVETRTMGVPMMGEGRVFDCSEEEIKCKRFERPSHFSVIAGIDFGIGAGHPTAAAWLWHDRDRDIIYLADEYRKEATDAVYHAEAIKRRGNWIPVSWPHDGHKTSDLTKSKVDGKEIKDIYQDHGVSMLPISARYERDVGGSQPQEPIIEQLNERIATGRFYVFDDLNYFFEEIRSFHRKDGKIVNRREDLIKAVLYALMMIRYANTQTVPRRHSQFVSTLTSHA